MGYLIGFGRNASQNVSTQLGSSFVGRHVISHFKKNASPFGQLLHLGFCSADYLRISLGMLYQLARKNPWGEMIIDHGLVVVSRDFEVPG